MNTLEPDPVATAAEPHNGNGMRARLNWLRAGVLGANDGIISVAGLVIGVAAATTDRTAILTAGVAGVVAGAVSMALGEYVSVSSQRDTERALIARERRELAEDPEGELIELAGIYQAKGLSPATARAVAEELTAIDPVKAHLDAELGLDAEDLTNPWHAALASAIAFVVGAALPLLAVSLASESTRILVTFAAVLVALVATGSVSAHLGRAGRRRAMLRLVLGGALAMAATFGIGYLLGVSGI
ncbi:VIT family protein [Actinotalea sp.]|uniref:VIT1/CCC1 transporter family protein n=1 Tax=Actinotalea sp. TaxID=1872145 RepID=UPI003563F1AF